MNVFLQLAIETTNPGWNSGIVAQDLYLATKNIFSLIPCSDPILLDGDVKFCEMDAVTKITEFCIKPDIFQTDLSFSIIS